MHSHLLLHTSGFSYLYIFGWIFYIFIPLIEVCIAMTISSPTTLNDLLSLSNRRLELTMSELNPQPLPPRSISVDEFAESAFKAVLRATEVQKLPKGPIIYGIIYMPDLQSQSFNVQERPQG
jgi:flagellar biosynthesis protein FlhB